MEEQFEKLTLKDELELRATIVLDPACDESFGHGRANFRMGRYPEALKHFERSLLMDANNPKRICAKACSLHEIGKQTMYSLTS